MTFLFRRDDAAPPPSPLKRGFNRLGLVLAVPLFVLADIVWVNQPQDYHTSMSMLIFFGCLAYGIPWAIGWVLSGFIDY